MLEPGLGVNQRAYHLVQPLTAVSTTAAEIRGHQEAVTRRRNNNAGGDMLAPSHEKTEGDLQLLTA